MDELLKLLRDDASLTPAQIAGRLGREEGEVESRIESLESEGVILGYRTVINEDKLEVDLSFTDKNIQIHYCQNIMGC